MKPTNITVNGRFATQPFTGVQRYGYELVRRLPVSSVITPREPLPFYPELRDRRLRVARSPLQGHLWEQGVLPANLISGTLLWSPGGSGPLAVRNQVLTIHDVAHLEHPEWYGRRFALFYRMLLPLLARRVRRILTVSEFSKERIVRQFGVPSDKVAAIPLGVDPRFRVKPHAEVTATLQRMDVHRPYILAVGAVSPRKNLSRLFAAWASVSNTRPDTDLVVVGKTGLAFAGRSSRGMLPPKTRVFDRVSDDDLVDLYNGATGFVFPSLYEGFGLPILEAMASGAPVIAGNVTSLPEVAGDAALLVDPYDTDAIARSIRRLVEDEALRNRLRAQGLARAAHFTWDATAAMTWHTLQETAAWQSAPTRRTSAGRAASSLRGTTR
jgi:glycosyltransferase involved in cell wall biosynthesis